MQWLESEADVVPACVWLDVNMLACAEKLVRKDGRSKSRWNAARQRSFFGREGIFQPMD